MAHKTGAAYTGGHIVHGCANAMYLPKVIKYNSKNAEAAKRYAEIARFIGLEGKNDAELVDALIAELRKMNKELNIPMCIKDYEGGMIDEKEFLDKLSSVAVSYTHLDVYKRQTGYCACAFCFPLALTVCFSDFPRNWAM